jgi:hypothetical protein
MSGRSEINEAHMPALTWQPRRESSHGQAREWLRRKFSGRSLTLADYVRAEELWACSSRRQAKLGAGTLRT